MIEYEKEIIIDVESEPDGKTVYITLYCETHMLNAFDVKTAINQHFAEVEIEPGQLLH